MVSNAAHDEERIVFDLTKVPFYHLDDGKLEAFAILCVMVAGKNATTCQKILKKFFELTQPWYGYIESPFLLIRRMQLLDTEYFLKKAGMGCYTAKARTIYDLAHSRLNLRTCSVDDLETIKGIGPKTSRFFVVHTRPNAKYAILDTHMLRHLRDMGIRAPKSTPTSATYARLEKAVLYFAEQKGLSPAEYDIAVWKLYSGRG